MVEERFRSFVSQWDIPYVYGMTCGELARMINGEGWIKQPCRLTVIPMSAWRRSMVWRDTGLPWVASSPNIPRADSPLYYASTGLFGEIAGVGGVSIGTRIQRPFECVVAVWLDAGRLSSAMNGFGLPGVRFDPLETVQAGKPVKGVSLRFEDPARAPLTAINFYLLDGIRTSSGRNLFAEAKGARTSFQVFDKVAGSDSIRRQLESGASAANVVARWKSGEAAFLRKRQGYLLYMDTESAPAAGREAIRPLIPRPAEGPRPAARTADAPMSPSPAPLIITVSRGDTVTRIARDFGVTVSDIALANPGLNVDQIKVGQKLNIPRASR